MEGAMDRPFKVIIAGGSVSGMVLANALEKAGIDYVLLEKREVAPNLGASVSVLPNAARVFDQLGVWECMKETTLPLMDRLHFNEHGKMFCKTGQMRLILERTTMPLMFMERRSYLEYLFNNLEDKSKVRGHTGVASFVEIDYGVKVETDQGETIEGSILIGADGVHSTVRKLMAAAVAEKDPKAAKALTECFTTRYKVLFATSKNHFKDDPAKQFIPDATVHNVYYRGLSGAAAVGVKGLVFWFLFVKEDTEKVYPNEARYTEADAEAVIAKYGHHQFGQGYTFQDLWDNRIKVGLVPLQEGVVKTRWHSGGRVVLLGDSSVKATVNPGFGANTCVEAAVHLVNELVPLLKDSKAEPSTAQIVAMFDRYEAKQRPRADLCVGISGYVTRFEAMETRWLRLLLKLLPYVPDSAQANFFLNFVEKAPTLDFLPPPSH